MAEFNHRFQVQAKERGTAFLPRSIRDLDLIFALQWERKVNQDNTVNVQKLTLQIEPVRWRATLAGCTVMVHQHLDGTFTVTYGPHRLGRYDAEGRVMKNNHAPARRAVEKSTNRPDFPSSLEIPQRTRDPYFPTAPTWVLTRCKSNGKIKPDIFIC